MSREQFQVILQAENPSWVTTFRAAPTSRPDGDADLGVVMLFYFILLLIHIYLLFTR